MAAKGPMLDCHGSDETWEIIKKDPCWGLNALQAQAPNEVSKRTQRYRDLKAAFGPVGVGLKAEKDKKEEKKGGGAEANSKKRKTSKYLDGHNFPGSLFPKPKTLFSYA